MREHVRENNQFLAGVFIAAAVLGVIKLISTPPPAPRSAASPRVAPPSAVFNSCKNVAFRSPPGTQCLNYDPILAQKHTFERVLAKDIGLSGWKDLETGLIWFDNPVETSSVSGFSGDAMDHCARLSGSSTEVFLPGVQDFRDAYFHGIKLIFQSEQRLFKTSTRASRETSYFFSLKEGRAGRWMDFKHNTSFVWCAGKKNRSVPSE
jgi:hypothetical protein